VLAAGASVVAEVEAAAINLYQRWAAGLGPLRDLPPPVNIRHQRNPTARAPQTEV
jgi:hypothetical protein